MFKFKTADVMFNRNQNQIPNLFSCYFLERNQFLIEVQDNQALTILYTFPSSDQKDYNYALAMICVHAVKKRFVNAWRCFTVFKRV